MYTLIVRTFYHQASGPLPPSFRPALGNRVSLAACRYLNRLDRVVEQLDERSAVAAAAAERARAFDDHLHDRLEPGWSKSKAVLVVTADDFPLLSRFRALVASVAPFDGPLY